MRPYYSDDAITLHLGDCRTVLAALPDASVQCCVTSPPYWGLRDYGVEGQMGLEHTPEEYVARMVEVFREVRRVLRDDGTLWLNLGDSYASASACDRRSIVGQGSPKDCARPNRLSGGLKEKDLCGIPWMVAFALRADGWYLRSDIIWSKPNPMPESVTDRPTKAHEYLFLLSKSERYYYNGDSIKEMCAESTLGDSRTWDEDYEAQRPERGFPGSKSRGSGMLKPSGSYGHGAGRNDGDNHPSGGWEALRRNKRSVWTVTTQPYKAAHFATFPPKLIEPCILAGCPVGGTVLDPFNGAGTTGAVSQELGRKYVGIELNEAYIKLTLDRVSQGVLALECTSPREVRG